METTVESNGAEKAKGATPVQVEAVKEAKQEEVKAERSKSASSGKTTAPAKTVPAKTAPAKTAPAKTAPSRRSREGDRDRSRDRQTERERQRRGERTRGGDSKGSGYKPRTRPECRVYISNIPFDLRWQEVKDLFRSEVGEVSFVELFEDESGKPRGCGIIEFEKNEHALLAMDRMNRYDLKGRKLVVKEDFDVERDRCGRVIGGDKESDDRPLNRPDNRQDNRPDNRPDNRNQFRAPPNRDYRDSSRRMSGSGSGGSGGSGLGTLASPSSTQWSNTFGLSPQFLDSIGITGPLANRIFVANLDYKVDDHKLREVFRLAGKVICAEVSKDKDGKSRGFGVVEMDHPVEAVQAISMFNNQMLFDRRMTVRMDRDSERSDSRPPKLPEGLRSIGMGLGAGGNPLHDVPRGVSSLPSSSLTMGMSRGSAMNYSPSEMRMQSLSSNSSMAMTSDMGLSGNGMQSHHDTSSMLGQDYSRNSMASSYSMGVGSNGSMSSSGMGSNAYGGYASESMPSSRVHSMSDYDRIPQGYSSYERPTTGQERPLGYHTNTSAYDLGTRLAPLGSTAPAAGSVSSSMTSTGLQRPTDTIVVNNLPVSCTWQDLRDKFCEVGDVLFADIRAKGTGVVRFSSDRDAQRACSLLNRSRMDGRAIEVDFY